MDFNLKFIQSTEVFVHLILRRQHFIYHLDDKMFCME